MVSSASSAAAAAAAASNTAAEGEEQQQQQQLAPAAPAATPAEVSAAEKEAVNATCDILSDQEKELSWLLEEDRADPNRDPRKGYNWAAIEEKASPAFCQEIQRHRKHPKFGNISMQLLIRFKYLNEFRAFRQRVKRAILTARGGGGAPAAKSANSTTTNGGTREHEEPNEDEDDGDEDKSNHRKRPRLQVTAPPTPTTADPTDPSNRPRRVPEAGLVAALPLQYKELARLWHQSERSTKAGKPNWDKIQDMASGPLQELLMEKRRQYGNMFDQQAVECLIPVKERRAFNIVMSKMDSKPSRTATTTNTANAATSAAAVVSFNTDRKHRSVSNEPTTTTTTMAKRQGKPVLGRKGPARGMSPPKLKSTMTHNHHATTTAATTATTTTTSAATTTDGRRRKKRLESFQQRIQQDLDDFRQDEFILMNKLIMECKREQALLSTGDGNHHHHHHAGGGEEEEQEEEE
jgi:very-short-patch-repair endonuclease